MGLRTDELNTEAAQRAMAGTKVTVRDDVVPDRKSPSGCSSYVEEAWPKREAGRGRDGMIAAHSNGHGLCFRVDFGDGASAWYDPDELDVRKSSGEGGTERQ